MRAKRGHILVEVDLDQKDNYEIDGLNGEKIKLWIGREYNDNNREKKPCVCKVIDINDADYPGIDNGDLLVVHHNMFVTEALGVDPTYLIDQNERVAIYSIPFRNKSFNNATQQTEWHTNRQIFAKLVDGELHPVCNNVIAERIKMPGRSEILIDPVERFYEDRVKVLRVSPEVDAVNPGDTVQIYKMADYEILYHWNNKEVRTIKVWQEDILAVIHE